MDRGAWQAAVHGVTESGMTERLSFSTFFSIYIYTHTHIYNSFPAKVITKYWVGFPMLYSRPFLAIYFICSSESHLVVSNSFVTPTDCSLPGSSIHGISQARIREWVAVPFSRDLPKPGIKPRSLTLQADSLLSEPPEKPTYGSESLSGSVVSNSLRPHEL